MKIVNIFLFSILLFLSGCGSNQPLQPKKPLVWVSVAPYQFFTARIGGGHLDVRSIVPYGADAHSFEPTPRQRESMKDGKIWFRIGESFERPLISLFQDRWTIVDLCDGIDLINESTCGGNHLDRHMWMSPKLVQKQARAIAKVLCEQFPEHRQEFEANLQTLIGDLEILDAEIKMALEPCKNHVLLVSHPAFGYYCQDYELSQLSVEFEGKDPRPKHLEFVMQQRPDVAIILPQHNNKGAEMIAEQFHLPITMIDPYSYHYFETMRALTKWIQTKK